MCYVKYEETYENIPEKMSISGLQICSPESTDRTLSSHRHYQLLNKELYPILQQELPDA